MMTQEQIYISDCSLLEADEHNDLSFREKIELCRLIDKLGVSSIDLCPIRQMKIDRLLIKSICSAVKNASVAVPVSLTDDHSVLKKPPGPVCRWLFLSVLYRWNTFFI